MFVYEIKSIIPFLVFRTSLTLLLVKKAIFFKAIHKCCKGADFVGREYIDIQTQKMKTIQTEVKKKKYKKINLYFQDESRFGLFTKNGKALTAKGVKPICPFQQVFQSLYLFGAVSPIDRKKFFLQMPHCNAANFQFF